MALGKNSVDTRHKTMNKMFSFLASVLLSCMVFKNNQSDSTLTNFFLAVVLWCMGLTKNSIDTFFFWLQYCNGAWDIKKTQSVLDTHRKKKNGFFLQYTTMVY